MPRTGGTGRPQARAEAGRDDQLVGGTWAGSASGVRRWQGERHRGQVAHVSRVPGIPHVYTADRQ